MSENYIFERGVDAEGTVIEVTGTPFYRKGTTGFADSVTAVQGEKLQGAPTYLFAGARANADRTSPLWSKWHDTNSEVDTVLDEKGILGEAGKLYVVDFQRGGIFVNDPSRVREAVTQGKLQSGAMALKQEEVNELLSYIAKGDVKALVQKGWLQGPEGSNFAYRSVGEFIEASNVDGFLRNTPGYVVVTPADEARAESSGYKAISEMLHNPRLQIRSGGKAALKAMLEKAQSFGWTKFGSHTDGFSNTNSGRAVVLDDGDNGVNGDSLYIGGRSVGVAPEALEARARIVGPVPSKEAEDQRPPRTEESQLVRPSLEEVLAFSRPHVSEAGFSAFEDGLRKLYG